MSGNQDGTTKPVYHSNHSYLFSEVIKLHPNLTTEELEKEFKTKVEGAYVTKLLDEYGAFYNISRDQVDAFKAFVADEMMWSRYIYDKPEVVLTPEQGKPVIGLTQEQGRDLVAKFKAEIAKLKEEHAAEKKELQSEHKAKYEAFYKGACQDYSSQIEKLWAENKRLEEENAEVKRLKENLINNQGIQYEKFEVLLAEKMDLEKDVERKEKKIKDLEDEVAEVKKDKAKLQKGLAELVESTGALKSSFNQAMAAVGISRDTVIQACQTEKKLEKNIAELEDKNKMLKEDIKTLNKVLEEQARGRRGQYGNYWEI